MTVVQNMVLHGRRAGTPKEQKTAVLTSGDMDRIKSQLNRGKNEEADRLARLEEEQKRFEASKTRQSQWSNTLAGQRKAKLAAKKAREEAEEAARVQIDLEEEIFRAAQRKKIIDKAKKLQFREQDRTKEFHSALLHTEVLKERDYQIRYKQEIDQRNRNFDLDFQEKARLEHEEGLRLEALKAQRARDAAKENLQALEAQKQVKKDRQNDQRNQWLAEGADLAAAAEEFEKSKIEQKNLAKQARLEYISQIDAQKQMIADIARLDAENEALDDQKREKFLSAKAKMTKMQKAKMKSIFDEKQAQRGKMAEKLAKEYREQEDNSEYLLKKAQEEKDFEQRMREKAKQEKLLKDQKDIAEHRAGQLKVKELADEKRRQMALEELSLMRMADEKFQQAQIEKQQKRRADLEAVTGVNLKMMNELAVAERKARDAEYHADIKQLETLKLEEDEFQKYADDVIKQAEARQRNTIPLKVVKARGAGGGKGPVNKYGIRPSYLASDYIGGQMPTYHNEVSNQIKVNLEPGVANESKQRLGFTW